MIISTERLKIRPYHLGDLLDYHQLNADVRNLTYELHKPYTIAESRKNLEYWLTVNKEFSGSIGTSEFGIELVEEKKLIGFITESYQNFDCQIIEIGIRIDYHYKNRGFATEALTAYVHDVFESTDVHRIFARSDARNIATARLFEKLRMTKEGVLRQNVKIRDGTYGDEVVYAILRDDIK